MSNWINWKYSDENDSEKSRFVVSKKFKLLVSLFFIIFLVTTNMKLIEVLSLADGQVIPQGRIKYVQHLEGGIVDEILVKEGDSVDINQPLVVLSKERATSDFEEIDTKLKSIDLAILRVKSEKKFFKKYKNTQESIKFFDSNMIKYENDLLISNVESISNERRAKESTIKKAEINLKNLNKRRDIVKEQEEISEKLLKAEATNRLRHLELLRELSDVEAQIDEQKAIIFLSKNELEKVNFEYNQKLNNELSGLNKEKAELKKRIGKYSDSLDRTVLKSPVTGIIKLISVNSKGAIITPGVTVAEIVPEDEKLIIEAKLPLSEIGYVKAGLEAKIRLNTPEGSRFQPISGKVTFVGADKVSNNSSEAEDYYLVKIETNEKSFNKKDETFKLYSGIPVMIGIITGKRSFMEYFVSPFKSEFSFALSER